MTGLADLFTGLFGGAKPPKAPEPDRLPPLARGYLPDYATGMELPPLARGRLPEPPPPPPPPRSFSGDVRAPKDLGPQRREAAIPGLSDDSGLMYSLLDKQVKAPHSLWASETLPAWRGQAFAGDPSRQQFTGKDPEGRTIDSLFHAGTVGGRNMPLPQPAIRNLASALAARMDDGLVTTNTRYPDRKTLMGGYVGSMWSDDTLPHSQDAPLGLEIAAGHPRKDVDDVTRHESGHALHRRMQKPGDLNNAENILGMAVDFRGDKNLALQQMQQASYAEERAKLSNPPGPGVDAKDYDQAHRMLADYAQKPSELFAESFRQYTTDPAAFKRKYPEAAALLRSIVNTNPRTNKLMTLSKNDLGRTLASGVG